MVNGVERMRAMFRRKAAAVVKAGQSQSRKEGEQIAQIMRTTAPKDDLQLLKSIRVEDETTFRGKPFIGVNVKAGDETTIVTNSRGQRFQNAKLQESGTKNMPANPFFNFSYRRRSKETRRNIASAVRKAWRDG